MRPPVPYFGGKMRLADHLVRLMAGIPHQHYVEPFAGSLAVLLAKPPVTHETVNDLDEHLVTFWRILRDRPDDLIRACELTPHSRVEQRRALDLDALAADATDLEVARTLWVALSQGRAGRRTRTGWRHYQDPSGSTGSMPDYLAGYVDRMPPAAARLRRVSLECRPALDVIGDYGRHEGVLLYVDPPYLRSSRVSGGYRYEMGSDAEHEALADALHSCRAAVVLSGYASPLYERLYDGWDRVSIDTATGQGGQWSERTEVVWSNRTLGEPDLLTVLAEEGEAS